MFKSDKVEFTGVVPFKDRQGFDSSAAMQMDLLGGASLALRNFAVGQIMTLSFARDNFVKFALGPNKNPQEHASRIVTVIDSNEPRVNIDTEALVRGAVAGGSMLKIGNLVRYCYVEWAQQRKKYLSEQTSNELIAVFEGDEARLLQEPYIGRDEGGLYSQMNHTIRLGELIEVYLDQPGQEKPTAFFKNLALLT